MIFAEEKDLIQESLGGREEMRRQILICRDRLLEDRRTLQQWMKDPKFKDKLNAMHLSAELAAAILRLYEYGPSYLSKYDNSLPNPHRYYNSLTNRDDGLSSSSSSETKTNNSNNNTTSRVLSLRELKEQEERLR